MDKLTQPRAHLFDQICKKRYVDVHTASLFMLSKRLAGGGGLPIWSNLSLGQTPRPRPQARKFAAIANQPTEGWIDAFGLSDVKRSQIAWLSGLSHSARSRTHRSSHGTISALLLSMGMGQSENELT